jgi:STE24 endopeptidase
MWQLLAVSGVVTASGFYLLSLVAGKTALFLGARGPADLYMMPSLILIMSLFGMLILPVQNWFSRRLEREADRYAIKMVGSPEIFIAVMKKLASMNLAETDPPLLRKLFLYNHPPVGERIRMAEGMMNSQKTESASR